MSTITEQIRESLTKRDGISEEAMRPLAEAYGAEVQRVNERLSAAGALLSKGLRSEAIHSALIAPNAIDDASKLDFAEVDEWFDILQFLGISVPPAILRDRAEQLNEAIIESQPLEVLLKRNRRLAIARAPLAWRLKVLRRIAELDSFNVFWQEDIEQWEKARHKEINAAARAAIANDDMEEIRALHDEVTQDGWRVAPEETTLRSLKKALANLSEKERHSQLAELAPQLHDAFCQFDESGARALLARWNKILPDMKTPVPGELTEQVEGTVLWIAEIEREAEARNNRAVAIGHLEAVIDRGALLPDLERAYHKTTTFDEPPPDELLRRYQLAVEERKLAKQRLFQASIGGIVAVTLLCIGALAWWQYRATQHAGIVAAHAEFQSLLDANDLASASNYFTDLESRRPVIAASPQIVSLSKQLEGLIADEEERARQFDEYLKAADKENAAEIDLAALSRAEDFAANESEKAAAFKVRRRRTLWDAKLMDEHSSQLLSELKTQREQLDQIGRGNADEQALLALADVASKLDILLSRFHRASSSAKQQVSSAKTQAASMETAIASRLRRMKRETDGKTKIFSAKSLDELAKNLKQFERDVPDSTLGSEFSAVALERQHWETAMFWNDYVEAAAKPFRSQMAVADIEAFKIAQKTMEKTIGGKLGSLPEAVSACLNRYEERKAILERVLGELPDTVIADFYTVVEQAGTGNRHFLYKTYFEMNQQKRFQPFREGDSVKRRGLEVVINDSGAVKLESLVGEFQVIQEPYSTIQWLLNEYEVRENAFLNDWEGEFLKLTAELTNRKELDSKVKEMLLQHLLVGACEGSDWLTAKLTAELLLLKNRASAQTNWYAPQPFDESLALDVRHSVVLPLGNLYRSRPQLKIDANTIRNHKYRWVGLLMRDSNGEIVFQPRAKSAEREPEIKGRLAVVRQSLAPDTQVDWVDIGTYKSGQSSLSGERGELIAGRPVFFYPE